MPSSGYTAVTFTAGEQPTTAKWNLLGANDASMNTGAGFNDGIIINRHLGNAAVLSKNLRLSSGFSSLATVFTGPADTAEHTVTGLTTAITDIGVNMTVLAMASLYVEVGAGNSNIYLKINGTTVAVWYAGGAQFGNSFVGVHLSGMGTVATGSNVSITVTEKNDASNGLIIDNLQLSTVSGIAWAT